MSGWGVQPGCVGLPASREKRSEAQRALRPSSSQSPQKTAMMTAGSSRGNSILPALPSAATSCLHAKVRLLDARQISHNLAAP